MTKVPRRGPTFLCHLHQQEVYRNQKAAHPHICSSPHRRLQADYTQEEEAWEALGLGGWHPAAAIWRDGEER